MPIGVGVGVGVPYTKTAAASGPPPFNGPGDYAANTIGYWIAQASTTLTDQGSGLVPVTAQDQEVGLWEDTLASAKSTDLAANPSQNAGGPLWNPAADPDNLLFNPPVRSTDLLGVVAAPYTDDLLYLAFDGILITQIGGNGRIMSVYADGGNDTDANAAILAFFSAANAIRPFRNGFLAPAQSFVDGDRAKITAWWNGTDVRWKCKIGASAVVEVTAASSGDFAVERVRIGKGTSAGEHANQGAIKAYAGFDYTLEMADNMDAWWLAD